MLGGVRVCDTEMVAEALAPPLLEAVGADAVAVGVREAEEAVGLAVSPEPLQKRDSDAEAVGVPVQLHETVAVRLRLGVWEAVGLRDGLPLGRAVRLEVSVKATVPVAVLDREGVRVEVNEALGRRVCVAVWVGLRLPRDAERLAVPVRVQVGAAVWVPVVEGVREGLGVGVRLLETETLQVRDAGLTVPELVTLNVGDGVALREHDPVGCEADRDPVGV